MKKETTAEAALFKDGRGEKGTPRFKRWIFAACLALVFAAGSAVYALTVEAGEYRTAMAFFEENGLSAEGLSRADVKAVYRDITTRSFTCSRTADVMRQSVPGWEIRQAEPTPEELAALWDRNVWRKNESAGEVSYHVDWQYALDEERGLEVVDKCLLECRRDGVLLWSAAFTDFCVEGTSRFGGVTAVWGWNETFSTEETKYGWIALVDETGTVLWQRRLEHHFNWEYIGTVLRRGDGTWAVFSRGDFKFLCLTLLNADGNELSCVKTPVGNLGIKNAALLGDGYVVQLINSLDHDTALLYWLDREGHVTDTCSYEADDCEYHLTDMIEFAGQIYLSGYAVPKQNDEGGRHEIAQVLDYVFSREDYGIGVTDEELTPIVRDNYTAVLLLCDPQGGSPKTFYSVKGSLGGRLSVNGEGLLEWDAESVTTTFFSPATSSFTIGGSCKVFRYTFDSAGVLIGEWDTGETAPYRR